MFFSIMHARISHWSLLYYKKSSEEQEKLSKHKKLKSRYETKGKEIWLNLFFTNSIYYLFVIFCPCKTSIFPSHSVISFIRCILFFKLLTSHFSRISTPTNMIALEFPFLSGHLPSVYLCNSKTLTTRINTFFSYWLLIFVFNPSIPCQSTLDTIFPIFSHMVFKFKPFLLYST